MRNTIFLTVFIVGIIAAVFLIQHTQIFQPKAAEEHQTCQASNLNSFKNCFAQAKEGVIDQIEISAPVICNTKDECNFGTLSDNLKPLTIYGKPNTAAGFIRKGGYEIDMMVFTNVHDITIQNIFFDDTKDAICDLNNGYCGSFLAFLPSSKNITIDGISTFYSKKIAIQFSGVTNLTVKNSKFIGSGVTSLWMDRAEAGGMPNPFDHSAPIDTTKINRFVIMENNIFVDSSTAAVNFSGIGTPENPNKLVNNFFLHNHSNPIYTVCGADHNQTCPGGQLVIERSENSIIQDNVIKDGNMDNYNQQNPSKPKVYTTGIELSDHIKNITIQSNIITNNSGAGIFADYNGSAFSVNPSSIIISENELSNNKNAYDKKAHPTQIYFDGAAVLNTNCYTANCNHSKKGLIYAYPNPCVINPVTNTCTYHLYWNSYNGNDTKVKLLENSQIVGSQPSGDIELDLKTTLGRTFQLYSGDELLDSVTMQSYSQN